MKRSRPDQLAAVVHAAQPTLLRLARRLCPTTEDARDLVQDVLERVSRRGIPEHIANPRAWLTTMLKNAFVDRCRAAARLPVHETFDDNCVDGTAQRTADEPAWARVTSADLERAVRRLDPIYRRTYELRMYSQLSYEQIAEREHITPVTVGTRLGRAREMLRGLLLAALEQETA